jgi:hypothetical protein
MLGVATIFLFACSSSSGGGGYGITNCPANPLPAACISCINSSCSSQLSTVNSACSAYYDCVCPTNADAGLSCVPSSDCSSTLTSAMNDCTTCDSPCSSSTMTSH